MENYKKYCSAFTTTFSIAGAKMENLEYNKIEEWDSIGHMTLIAELEQIFSISIETDDVVDFSSFKKGKEIIKKYGINIQ
ncbi:MAG: acyl carrier protein [Pelagibacterales bacterium]|nr:acyl carrier protein [Pelagibacterales bacterium]